MADQKNKLDTIGKWFYGIVFGIILLLVLLVVVVIAGQIFGKPVPNNPVDQSGIFGLILTGITITIASSIFIPRITLRKEVQDEVTEQIKQGLEQFKKEIRESYTYELKRTDAHISRMISLLIADEYPVWAIGWVFRSLKRYLSLQAKAGESITLNEYRELIYVLANIARKAQNKFLESVINPELKEKILNQETSPISEEILKAFSDRFFAEEAKLEREEDKIELAFRTAKDYLDTEYQFLFQSPLANFELTYNERTALNSSIEELIKEVSLTIQILILIIHSKKTGADLQSPQRHDIIEHIQKISSVRMESAARDYHTKLLILMQDLSAVKNDTKLAGILKDYFSSGKDWKKHLLKDISQKDTKTEAAKS